MSPFLFESDPDHYAFLQVENEALKKQIQSLEQRAERAERILEAILEYPPEEIANTEAWHIGLQKSYPPGSPLSENLQKKLNSLLLEKHRENLLKQTEMQLLKTNRRLQLLTQTLSRLLQSREPQQIVKELCQAALSELDSQFFFNYLLEDNTSRLHLNACAGIPPETEKEIEWLEHDTTVCSCVAKDGCRIVVEHVQTSNDPRLRLVRTFGIRAYACHPLLTSNGQILGTLSFGTCTHDTYSEDELTLMKSVADHVAVAMERKRFEEVLRRLAQFPEENPNPILRMTSDGSLLYANQPGKKLWALQVTEPNPSQPNALHTLASYAFQSKYPVEAEIQDLRGETYFFTAVQPEGENYINLYGRNITNRKRMEEDLYRAHKILEAVLNSTPILIACLNRDFRFVVVNRAYAAADQKEPDFFPGRHHFELYPNPENEAIFREVLVTAQPFFVRAKPFKYAKNPERGITYWDWSLIPICSAKGEVEFLVLSLADVTPVQQAEEALRETDRRKDEFLAILGHELRNPVAAIVNAAYLLNRSNLSPEKEIWFKGIITEQAQQLLRLINDLQDVSRIARGKIKLEFAEVRIAEVVSRSVESVSEIYRNMRHHLTVEMQDEGMITGDSVRLQQILVNLLSNACKYTPEGGCIRLVVQSESDGVILRVIDNGIGISPEVQMHIFEMFTQVEAARKRSQGGLGIGLSLVKMLTELHGGSVSVFSEGEGKGSTFEIRLPKRHLTTSLPISLEPTNIPEACALQVLVVEDNLALAHMLSDLLTEQGHHVQHAHDGLAALSLANQKHPDVVLLDIGLPKMDGYEVARRLRSELGLSDTLIIAITAWGQERDQKRSVEAGINHHLVKPVEYSKILQTVSQWYLQLHSNVPHA